MQKKRAEEVLERFNKPVLILAVFAIILYLLELFRVVPASMLRPFLWTNFLIDLIFLLDLTAKSIVLGRSYLRSPWFLIDFLSTLPLISSAFELMGAMGPQLQATRVARGARVARIARVSRLARLAKVGRVARLATAIRAKQGLSFLKVDSKTERTPRFNRSLFIGVPLLLVAFMVASSYITNSSVVRLEASIGQEIEQAQTQADLNAIMERYDVATSSNPVVENTIMIANGGQEVAVSLQQAYARADRISGVMLLVLLITIGLSVFISSSLSRDRSIQREQLILSQCFSPPIVDKFYNDPEVVERFYRQWMSVFFIDIRGFTRAVEKDSGDVEGLALKLRKVMDVARQQIVISHEGIIDKFMGDAVMGWVGGHFSVHWKLLEDVRHQLHIDQLHLAAQDVKSFQREIERIESKEPSQKHALAELRSALLEAETRKSELEQLQQNVLDNDPGLASIHQNLMLEYRQRVAKSAVSCCLRIWEEVEKLKDPGGFNELKVGIGSGDVLIGNFGATDQIAYTVLGPTVNRAARLEPASAQAGCHILIDENTFELLKDDPAFRFRRLPMIEVKGISEAVHTYEPFFTSQVSESFLKTFNAGVVAMEAGKTQVALECFHQSDQLQAGGDPASRIWSKVCKDAIEQGRAVGIRVMKK